MSPKTSNDIFTFLISLPVGRRVEHSLLNESYISVIKVLNKSVKAKYKEERKRQEPSCSCHDNETCYLDKDFGNLLKE